MQTMYCRNLTAIHKLGFCPGRFQKRGDRICNTLLDIHELIADWEDKIDDVLVQTEVQKEVND
jgi:hypothetical protein